MSLNNTLGDIDSSKTVFFLCDMQEKFSSAIKYFADILEVSKRLVSEILIVVSHFLCADVPFVVCLSHLKLTLEQGSQCVCVCYLAALCKNFHQTFAGLQVEITSKNTRPSLRGHKSMKQLSCYNLLAIHVY